MSTKRGTDRFVLAEDCVKQHTRLELALFGKDGREGVVKDISDIKSFIRDQAIHNEEEKQDKKEKRATLLRYKFLTVGFIFSILGFLANYILNKIG